MSAISKPTCEEPDSRRICSSAAFPFSAFRQTMTTRAPIWARPSAVSFPIPLFAPVTIHIFSLTLAGGITCTFRTNWLTTLDQLLVWKDNTFADDFDLSPDGQTLAVWRTNDAP
jgi:hypothetical protein